MQASPLLLEIFRGDPGMSSPTAQRSQSACSYPGSPFWAVDRGPLRGDGTPSSSLLGVRGLRREYTPDLGQWLEWWWGAQVRGRSVQNNSSLEIPEASPRQTWLDSTLTGHWRTGMVFADRPGLRLWFAG